LCIQQSKRESEDCAFGTSSDHRVDRFEEALQIIVPLLRAGQDDFDAWRRLRPTSGTPKDRCAGPRRSSRCGQHSSAQGEQPKLASPDEIVEMLRGYAREGLSRVQLWLSPSTIAGLEWFAAVLDLLDHSEAGFQAFEGGSTR
jgi:hypothetical protein